MRRVIITMVLWALGTGIAVGQSAADANRDGAPRASPVDRGSSEWMARAGAAFGVQLFHSVGGHKYLLSSLSWGRVLTAAHGPGVLRGRFEWAIEVVPLFAQRTPHRTAGIGVTPLTWRWNFDTRGNVVPFAELAGGLLWTRDPVPSQTARGNFTAHAAYGIRYFFRPSQALVVNYLFHHISNGNRLERNPGVNAHVIQMGLSVIRPSRTGLRDAEAQSKRIEK